MFSGFSHVMMFVTDFDRAVGWYTTKLGCRVNFSHPPHYASLQEPQTNTRIDLHPTESDSRDVGHGPMPYFKVQSVAEALASLAAKGIKVGKVQQEGPTKFATFWDSEGNALGVQEYTAE